VLDTSSFDRADYRAEVQAALSSLTYARQVLLHSVALLDAPAPADAPNPSGRPAIAQGSAEPLLASQPEAVCDARAEQLRQLAALPPEAKLSTEEASIYLNCRPELLRTWRWQKRGPPFEGKGKFVRYIKGKLDAFMSA
jgi:hypothetical protein